MRAQRLGGLVELAVALVLAGAAVWQWRTGTYLARTPVLLPDGGEQWLTFYNGPQLVSAFALAAAAIGLLVDGVVRLRRARQPRPL